MQYLYIFLSAFLLTLVGVCLMLYFFPKIGLMDHPERYGHQRPPVPYPAGIIFWFVFSILAVYFLHPFYASALGLIVASGVLTLVSFYDDRHGIHPLLRLLIQVGCAGILIVFHIGITHLTLPFYGVVDLTVWQMDVPGGHFVVLADLLTIFLVVLFTNSMNWLDGSPGLPSGISLIATTVLFLLALRPDLHTLDQTQFATMALILVGSCLAFVLFDFPTPKILIGDSGSMFLGFTLGVLAILSGGKLATTFLVLGVPLFDALFVIFGRILHKKAPWKGDYTHLHHRLLHAGFSPRQTALIIYALALAFGGVALFLQTQGKLIALLALIALLLAGEIYLAFRSDPLQKVKK